MAVRADTSIMLVKTFLLLLKSHYGVTTESLMTQMGCRSPRSVHRLIETLEANGVRILHERGSSRTFRYRIDPEWKMQFKREIC